MHNSVYDERRTLLLGAFDIHGSLILLDSGFARRRRLAKLDFVSFYPAFVAAS